MLMNLRLAANSLHQIGRYGLISNGNQSKLVQSARTFITNNHSVQSNVFNRQVNYAILIKIAKNFESLFWFFCLSLFKFVIDFKRLIYVFDNVQIVHQINKKDKNQLDHGYQDAVEWYLLQLRQVGLHIIILFIIQQLKCLKKQLMQHHENKFK